MTALLLAAADPKAHQAEVDTWHQARLARLQSDSGWLTVVGLSWLQEGANPAGSGEGATVKFPATAPRTLGTFTRTGERITFSADPGVTITADGKAVKTVEMLADDTGKPTTLSSGTFTWLVIRRGARLGVRIRDSNAPARTGFKGVERFAVDGQWQVSARFEPSATPRKLKIATVIGTTEELVMPGTLVFTLDGKEHRLEPVIEDGSDELFIIFADQTSGKQTYGAGRFLYAPMPKNGASVLDFNKAYNPPCAFTRFATCPLPPPQNRLAVSVTAGEKTYGAH